VVLARTRRLVDWLSFLLAGIVGLLNPRTQRRLAGGRPVEADGNTLDPSVQLLLELRKRNGAKPWHAYTPEQARRAFAAESRVGALRTVPVDAVRELTVAGGDGPIPARHYTPPTQGTGPAPLLVYLHGGGFVIGDLDSYDAVCRLLCRHAGVHVLSVDYRLAPEHHFPAAIHDAKAALEWAFGHAAELGADPARVAIGGDSAGGNLAATVAQLVARDGGPQPAMQLLIYPATDIESPWPSRERFRDGNLLLTTADIDFFEHHYMGETPEDDPLGSPLHGGDLSGLAPALVATAGFDPLRDEGEAYATALADAGSTVILRRFGELLHGFVNLSPINPACHDAMVEIAGVVRAMLALHNPNGTRP
jgi:acetyl esterase